MNSAGIEQLAPQPVWQEFAALSAVPRPSKKEERARAHARAWAQRHGFASREDGVGNVLIDVPATPGHERAPITILQGHLDMVCEKNAGTEHDFERDPIRLLLETDAAGQRVVRAAGTTLGADNGLGVALAMAAAIAPDVVHGPLELLLTSDEEMGMSSARELAADFVRGRRMINLDSEEDNALYIGCAGGCDTVLTWRFEPGKRAKSAEVARISVAGLRGGHSGCDIHLNRFSAIKLLTQALHVVSTTEQVKLQIAEIRGGSKRNVIPREASAVVAGPQGLTSKLRDAAGRLQAIAQRGGENACTIAVVAAYGSDASRVLTRKDSERLIAALLALPHGVLAVVPEIPGLVQTSNSTSTIATSADGETVAVTVGCLSRSSSSLQLNNTLHQLEALGALAGAEIEHGDGYSGWQPNPDSPLLAICRRIYREKYGAEPLVTAIHAGLECGVLDGRIGEGQTDMISFGPSITGAHSPDERVYVDSVAKIWEFLKAVLRELA